MIAAVVGVGLIGGSFALSLKEKGLATKVLGYDANFDNAKKAIEMGVIDEIATLDDISRDADFIAVSIPVNATPNVVIRLLNHVSAGQVIIDMGSTKQELCEMVSMHRNRGRFVATHPMWGTEFSGPEAAQKGAFVGRTVVMCETEKSDSDALELVKNVYTTIGMPIKMMGAEEHDLHTAYVSHISHITSFALALTVLEKEREAEHIFDLAGGGFESTVRLAKSASSTWVPIFMQNKYNVLDVLREHIHQLQIMRRLIERDDVNGLSDMMKKA
ncbi:MAG: prephenate dehydrogenase, partial [Rikenellaceae bacterium]